MDAESPPFDPALSFLRSVWALNHAVERCSARMERTLGVTAQQRTLLRFAAAAPGVAAGHLAVLMHLDPGSITSLLRRLEAAGLLERRRDPVDGRRVRVHLTERGATLAQPHEETVEAGVAALFREIGPDAAGQAAQVLDHLAGLLRSAAGAAAGQPARPSPPPAP